MSLFFLVKSVVILTHSLTHSSLTFSIRISEAQWFLWCMMNFTSSVSDLECLLLKFKSGADFKRALEVSNILDVVVSE